MLIFVRANPKRFRLQKTLKIIGMGMGVVPESQKHVQVFSGPSIPIALKYLEGNALSTGANTASEGPSRPRLHKDVGPQTAELMQENCSLLPNTLLSQC